LFIKRINSPYFTPEYTNSFSYFTGWYGHLLAVIAGGMIGAEVLNFHDPLIARKIKFGRRFYFPVLITFLCKFVMLNYVAWLTFCKYDNLHIMSSVYSMIGCTFFFGYTLYLKSDLSMSRWNFFITIALLLVMIFSSIIMVNMQLRRHINQENQKKILTSIKEKGVVCEIGRN
jgi:hypothetical protein